MASEDEFPLTPASEAALASLRSIFVALNRAAADEDRAHTMLDRVGAPREVGGCRLSVSERIVEHGHTTRRETAAGSRSHEILLAVIDTIGVRLDDLPQDVGAARERIVSALLRWRERSAE